MKFVQIFMVIMENIPYIWPSMLLEHELHYEMGIRGVTEIETFTKEALQQMLHTHQLQEMRQGFVAGTITTNTMEEIRTVATAITMISNESNHEVEHSKEEVEWIRNRLLHLLNRARRIDTRTRSQQEEVERLKQTIKNNIIRWGPRERRLPFLEHTQSMRLQSSLGQLSENASLTRQPTPETHQKESVSTEMPTNSTPTQTTGIPNRQLFGPPSTFISRIGNPQNTQSVLKSTTNTHDRNHRLRFSESIEEIEKIRAQDGRSTRDVLGFLNQMSQAYAHAADVYEQENPDEPSENQIEHQKLLDKMQSLMLEVQRTQTAIEEGRTNGNDNAQHGPNKSRPIVPMSLEPQQSPVTSSKYQRPTCDLEDPEQTVHRQLGHSSQFAVRKQISPDRWGFTFSGEESSNRRDTSPQNFLVYLESNRLAEGYSKATMLTFMNVLLTGIALTWWTLNQRKITSYEGFMSEFKNEFFPEDFATNAFIELCAYKQKEEPVMRYLTAFQTKASQCVPYPSEAQIVSILKKNVRDEFQLFLALKNPRNFVDVKRACKEKAELDARNVTPNKTIREESKPRRHEKTKPRSVYTLEVNATDEESEGESGPTEFEVCYIQQSGSAEGNATQRKEYHCFNCNRLGHLWRKCPDKITEPFCMYCGRKGVKISDCPNERCQNFYKARAERRATRADNPK